jgi:hypothetical protein
MNVPSANPSCRCVDCPGAGCTCGCQDAAASGPVIAAPACACGPGCACDAAEQGCLCATRSS